ncbi:helix-turn-helix domain-containing protein [Micromonospora sp. ATA51]|uniref:helix-turn-helix domain-containing protein n=1 Tax=Micromonospora sp. ATA51 TaxID=2806098 RepID=UPI002814A29F|nr:helix-turn-helix domain-containing protein [Micromonospora sp. ATA51]
MRMIDGIAALLAQPAHPAGVVAEFGWASGMPRAGRPKAELVLPDVERQTLLSWSRRAKTAQALALRARIVLACAEGATNKDVAAALGVWPQTVNKWRARFVRDRLEGLSDEPRPGAARKITDEQVEAVITAGQAPAGSPDRIKPDTLTALPGPVPPSSVEAAQAWRTAVRPSRVCVPKRRASGHARRKCCEPSRRT